MGREYPDVRGLSSSERPAMRGQMASRGILGVRRRSSAAERGAASFRRQHLGVVDRHGEDGLAETRVRKDGEERSPFCENWAWGRDAPPPRRLTPTQPRQQPAPRLAPRRGASYLRVAG